LEKMYKLIGKEIRYPKEARENGIQGKIFVQFVVNEEGKLSDIQVIKGIGDGCDEEAMRVMALTKWNPAEHEGKKVKQRLAMLIVFALD
ncbi:MAG: energy transducer TonB, partial [Thermoflexibacter sp.]|nr:energy transducer TonB [Thermoflexibacter sp.]